MADKIKNSYRFSKSFYDDAITQGKWWSKHGGDLIASFNIAGTGEQPC